MITNPVIITKRNIDSEGNPISIYIIETKQIFAEESVIVLKQVPDEVYRVKIQGYKEIFDREKLKQNEFKVDYVQGVVYFHPKAIGKTIVAEYYGIGYELISCSRIFTKYDKYGNVLETLEELIGSATEQLELIKTLGNSVAVIDKLETTVENGNSISNSISEKIIEVTNASDTCVNNVNEVIQKAKDDVINVSGNKEFVVLSSEWVLNGDVYEKQITHTLNSENLHVTTKDRDTKDAVMIGYKILDKSNILLKSDEAINMSVILSASYYHAVQTISDNVAEEVIRARKSESSLDNKIGKIDESIASINEDLDTIEKKNSGKPISVELFGLVGDGTTDNTEKLKNALSQCKNLYFPKKVYRIELKENDFFTFSDLDNINLLGEGTIFDTTEYTRGETLRNIFKFVRCKNINVTINYNANQIANWETDIGYVGASFLYFEENCYDINYKGQINNARYGIRSGDYRIASKGYCSKFDIDITTNKTGYPVALYLSDDVKLNVNATDIHRATYLAGCNDVRGNIYYNGFTMATMNVLLTNSLTSSYTEIQDSQIARGCKNIKLNVKERNATTSLSNSAICGIHLQWVARGTKFDNIHFNVDSITSNNNRVIGGLAIQSKVKESITYYPYNWEDFIEFGTIKLSGVIDRTNQTIVNSSWGDIYIEGYDSDDMTFTHAPIFTDIIIEDFKVLKNITMNNSHIRTPKLSNNVIFNNVDMKNNNIAISCPTAIVKLNDSILGNITTYESYKAIIKDNSYTTNVLTNGIEQNVSLLNNWVNFGSPYQNMKVVKNNDRVSIYAFLKGGTTTSNTVLFNLDNEFRPRATHKFMGLCDSGLCSINVNVNGDVALSKLQNEITNGWLLLECEFNL